MTVRRTTPDRAQAAADLTALDALPPEASCPLPVGRVRTYIVAYLDSHREIAGLQDLAVVPEQRSVSYPPEIAVLVAPLVPVSSPAPQTRPETFRPSLGTCLVLLLGLAVIALSAWVGTPTVEKLGGGLSDALVGAYASVLVLTRSAWKYDPDEPRPVPPLKHYLHGWRGGLLGFAGVVAAVAAVAAVAYWLPRLAGFAPGPWPVTTTAVFVVALFAVEWGLRDAG